MSYKLATDNEVSIANFGGENPQLKRTSNAVPLYFPYDYNNTLSITSSFWGNETLTDYYYYFYNWNVKEICSSPRLAVEAKIGSNEPLSISIADNCPYDSLILTANGNFNSYEWSNQATNQNLIIYDAGEYTVNAYDSLGCLATETINIPSILSFNINTNQVLCEGSSIFLQCLSGFDSYSWSTGETTNAITINSSGYYSVEATDNNGCEVSDEIFVPIVSPQQVEILTSMDSLIICNGSEFNFNVPPSFDNSVWNNSISSSTYTGTASNLGENIVTVVAQDENGCFTNDTVVLKVVDCTSIKEYLSNIKLFPNPTRGEFIIQHSSLSDEILSIRIIDVQSRLIEERPTEYAKGILSERFDISRLNSGLYLIELVGKKGKTVRKVILE
jgi:hypothetical protein